jgi:putative CocE/NonD family hydrolase
MLSTGGWYDVYIRSSIALFQESGATMETRHLLMGPWAHSNSLPAIQGECHFGPTASGVAAGVAAIHLDFFGRYLCDEPAAIPRARYFVMNAGRWDHAAQWPPSSTEDLTFYLRGDDPTLHGSLRQTPADAAEAPHSYLYNPAEPTPTVGGRLMSINGLIPGPLDQSPLADRSDVLCFDAPAQSRPLTLVGPVFAHLYMSVDASSVDMIVKLIDLAPDGRAYPITDGVARLTQLEPGCIDEVTVVLADTAWLLRSGHALRVQIQSANYPHIDPNMMVETGRSATITIHHDARRPSAVRLTRLPN